MADFNTIHIFAYGENQLISGSVNYKQAIADTTSAADLIADVEAQRPAEANTGSYHVIHIFEKDVKYISSDAISNFTASVDDLDSTKLDALVTELKSAYEASLAE